MIKSLIGASASWVRSLHCASLLVRHGDLICAGPKAGKDGHDCYLGYGEKIGCDSLMVQLVVGESFAYFAFEIARKYKEAA